MYGLSVLFCSGGRQLYERVMHRATAGEMHSSNPSRCSHVALDDVVIFYDTMSRDLDRIA